MKITQLREKDGNLTLSTTDLDTFLQKIKTETKTQPVSTFRQQLRYCLPGKRCNEADRLPKVLPAAEFRKTNGVCQMKTYNGIVELTVGPLSGKSEIALVKRLAWEQPQTRLVFTGSSGRTVKIWTTFTRPNNSLPGKREEAEVFHAHAYRLAVKCYQPQLPFDILLKEPKLEQYSRLSFDPEAMYRPDSIQFYLAQTIIEDMAKEKGFTVKLYEDSAVGMNDLKLGRIDAYANTTTNVNAFTHNNTDAKFRFFDEQLLANNVAYFLQKTDDGDKLTKELDDVIQDMLDDGTVAKITEKWMYADMTKLIQK